MKKLIFILMILSILIIGCSDKNNYAGTRQTTEAPDPNIGGGCGVAGEELGQGRVIRVPIARAL